MFRKICSFVLVLGLIGGSMAFAVEPQSKAPQQNGEVLLEIVATHAPDLLPGFEAAFADHKAVHESLEVILTQKFTENLMAQQAFVSEIIGKLQSGEIDRKTAKQMLEAKRLEVKTNREAIKGEMEALKASFNLSQEANKALMNTLNEAIAAANEPLILETLNQIYTNLLAHIQFDYAKLSMMQ